MMFFIATTSLRNRKQRRRSHRYLVSKVFSNANKWASTICISHPFICIIATD